MKQFSVYALLALISFLLGIKNSSWWENTVIFRQNSNLTQLTAEEIKLSNKIKLQKKSTAFVPK